MPTKDPRSGPRCPECDHLMVMHGALGCTSLRGEARTMCRCKLSASALAAAPAPEPFEFESIWLTPQGDKVAVPIISIEVHGAPKAYLRLFLRPDRYTEWGWILHESAVQIWPVWAAG